MVLNRRKYHLWFLIWFLSGHFLSNAQDVEVPVLKFKLTTQNADDEKVADKYDWPDEVISPQAALDLCKLNISSLKASGYLGASLDSFLIDTAEIKAQVFIGKKYRWVNLGAGNIPPDLLDQIKYPRDSLAGRIIKPAEYARLTDRILTYFENNGFPFVEIRLTDRQVTDSTLSGNMELRRGPLFEMDTIEIHGTADVRKNFLYNYLGFKPKDTYNEKIIASIDRKLNQLPYVNRRYNTKVYFIRDKARVVVYIDKRKNDRIDGVVGFAPNSNSVKSDLLLTGEVNVDLKNLAGTGKALKMHWKSFLQNSSELQLAFAYPYVLKTPIGLDVDAQLQKFDTTQTNVRFNFGGQYLFHGTNHIRLFYENNFSILENVDTARIRQTMAIPASNPVTIQTYGIDVFLQNLDYKINPRQGYSFGLVVSLGRKTIEKDNRIEAVTFNGEGGNTYTVYDSINLTNLQGNIRYDIQYFQPIFRKSAIVTSVYGKHLIAPKIFYNELYRIGGNNLLRGFDENSILASSYTVVMLEYRYLLSKNSNFNLFANAGYYEDRNVDVSGIISNIPVGFGAGVNLEVKTGILTMAYALGFDQNNPVQFSRAKIHFGIINYL